MLQINNYTPFIVELSPWLDEKGNSLLLVIIKASFVFTSSRKTLLFANEQKNLVRQDIYYGKPGLSSIRYESDTTPEKPFTDVILNGHAYAPSERGVTEIVASLRVDQRQVDLHIFGNRYWEKNVLTHTISAPERFVRMPLLYENAFGGRLSQTANNLYCKENPVGKGFHSSVQECTALPNIENPRQRIVSPSDCPRPAGLGGIEKSWSPRIEYAGTYDSTWEHERMPLQPLDFDSRFYNAAHPELCIQKPLANGAFIIGKNLSEEGLFEFQLPHYEFEISARIKGRDNKFATQLDTVLIEPDDHSVTLIWKASIRCGRDFLYIDTVTARVWAC
jgi:hypothetical protein